MVSEGLSKDAHPCTATTASYPELLELPKPVAKVVDIRIDGEMLVRVRIGSRYIPGAGENGSQVSWLRISIL